LFFLFGNINAQRNATEKEIQDRAKQKVGLLCEYISTIADKEQGTLQERLSFSQKALSLFIGKGNSYDENGFTPLLKLMYEYSQKITTIFNNIKQEETYNYKKNKVLQAENNKDIIMKENNEEEEEEEEINIGNNNFENFNNNNPNQTLDNKISSMNLSKN